MNSQLSTATAPASHPGELSIVGFEGVTAPLDLRARIAEGRVGGVIVFGRNLGTPQEVAALVGELGAAAPEGGPPLIVSLDQEGGRVQRLRAPLTVWPPMARVGALGDEAAAEAVGRALGEELRVLGFNLDYAPVLDVHTNPANPVIGDRAFATTAEGVAERALGFLRGLEAAGVRGCGKHFPGHGDTHSDSHLELPRVEAPLERLLAVELAPFAAAVRAGIGMIMTAHVVLPALDERPATMSPVWIDGVLRGQLGYRGVVVTDDLDMKAVADHHPVDEMVRAALAAGVDAFLACRDPERQRQVEEALLCAAADPVLGPRVTEAQARLRAFRATLAPPRPAPPETVAGAFPDPSHQALADRFR